MITIHDFTVLPEGRFAPLGGEVIHCPSCGRNGILEHEPGVERCVHAETTNVLGDGMLIAPTDSCEIKPE